MCNSETLQKKSKNFIASIMIYEMRLLYFILIISSIIILNIHKYFQNNFGKYSIIIYSLIFLFNLFLFVLLENKLLRCNLNKFIEFEKSKRYLFVILIVITIISFFSNTIFLSLTFLFAIYYGLVNTISIILKILKRIQKTNTPQKLYGFNKEIITLFAFILIGLLYIVFIVLLFPKNEIIETIIGILMMVIMFVNAFLCEKVNKKYENSKILIQNSNIDYMKFLNNNIVTFGTKDNYQIMLLDLNDIFPSDSNERKVYVTNQYCYYTDSIENSAILAVALPRVNTNKRLDIYFTYKLKDNKIKKRRCTLYITIESHSFGTYISNYKFKDFKFALLNHDKQIEYLKNDKFNKLYIPLNSIKYNFKIKNDISFNSKLEPRKWLLHNDGFGFGKSSFDYNFAMKYGLQPIVISPWEENYDNDILQLIFNKLSSKYSNPPVLTPPKNIIPLVCVSFAGTFLFIFSDPMKKLYCTFSSCIVYWLEKSNIIPSAFSNIPCNYLRLIIYIFVLISLWFSIMKFLPSIILLKKDNSKIYQEYYINQIVRIFNENKSACLIIEDIDRLSPNVYNDVFRILSLINKHVYIHDRFIGIISLDKKVLEKNDKFKDNFDNIKNKLVCYHIGDNHNPFDSIKKYKDDGICFLQTFTKKDLSKEYKRIIKKYAQNSKSNFRDAKFNMNMLIQTVLEENNSTAKK